MDNIPTDRYNVYMEILFNGKPDGFLGETLIVLPTEVFNNYAQHTIIKRLYLTDAGFFPHATRHFRERADGIEEYIFLFCTAGSGVIEVNKREYRLCANEGFCIPHFQGHRYWADEAEPWSILFVHFKGDDCSLYPLDELNICRFTSQSAIRRLEFLFSSLFRTLEHDYTLGNFIYISQTLALILGECFQKTQENSCTDTQNRQVTSCIRYMYNHISENLTLGKLCKALNLSKSTLSSAFQICTGHAPIEFFTRLKMKEACKLLRSGNAYIYETAHALGYQDQYYFSRTFKKIIGTSPREYQNGDCFLNNSD